METMSAIPIEDRVAMSMAQVSRAGIDSLRTAQGVIEIPGDQEIPPASDSQTQADPRTCVFECPNDFTFTARIEGQTAWLFLPGQTVSLPQVPSASGAKYSDGQTTFWNKGDEARLEIGEDRHQECSNNRARAIWEHAKLNGVDFRAVGNEPGWHLELKRGQTILLVSDYGQSSYVFDTPEPQEGEGTGTTTYRAQNQEHDLELRLQSRPCRDSMSGELFETTVTVNLDGRTFQGCGRALH
jgi:putative lipoprotein